MEKKHRLLRRQKSYLLESLLRPRGLAVMLFTLTCCFAFGDVTAVPNERYSLFQQAQVAVSGTVTDNHGNPIEGASVTVENINIGTTTDENGKFSLNVPSNSIINITFVGFETQRIQIRDKAQELNVELKMAEDVLDQVVVIGYGTQKREAVTGSVSSISGTSLLEVPGSNITESLQGRLPGIQLTPNDTKPGATMQIRIRGSRSLSASNDPLIVLDGIPFPGSISDINPNTIESIDVLKDASATAIYGSRGANGVIMVTTKKGRLGPAKINLNTYAGFKNAFGKYPMMNGEEYTQLKKDAEDVFPLGGNEELGLNTDWQSFLYRTGYTSNNELNVSKGTEEGNYSFGIGYYRDQAIIPTQNFSRYSINAAVDQKAGKYFRFGLRSNNNYNLSNGGQIGLYNALTMSPLVGPYNDDGTFRRTGSMISDTYWLTTAHSIHEAGEAWVSQNKGFGSYNLLYGEVSAPWVQGLKYRVNVGVNYRSSTNGNFTGEGINNINPATQSTASIGNNWNTVWTIENLLTYDRVFGKHSINLTGLYSAEQSTANNSAISGKDIPAEAFQYYNIGYAQDEITVDPNSQGYIQSALISYMARGLYSFDNRYMLTATYRRDESSRLAPGHKAHDYYAFSGGWNIANEDFMANIKDLNQLKLRVGFGQTSNQAIAPYSTLGRLSSAFYNFGDDFVTAYSVTSLANANLSWEFSKTWNFGLDFALFDYRLTGTLEYYRTKTRDILLNERLAATAGVGSFTNNIGSTENNGIELSLNGTILKSTSGWTWEAGINVYGNRNKITALSSGVTRDEGNAWFVGHPINVIYDYKNIGLWQSDDPYLDVLEPGGNVGMVKVQYHGDVDASGKPTRAINADDREILDVNPKFEGGFNTRVSYKGFDLALVGTFRDGGILVSTLYGSAGYLNLLTGRRNNVKVDYWMPDNTGAKFPYPGGIISSDNPKYGSTLGYFNGSYMKVRTITLGYDLTRTVLKKSGMDNFRVYFTAQNPFVLFSPYNKLSGMDPEPNSTGDQNQAVAGYQSRILVVGTNTPTTRNYILGINLTF